MICPKCKTDHASRSHRRGPIEHIVAIAGYYPYRCLSCKTRFIRMRGVPAKPASADRPGVEREIRATRSAMKVKRKRRELLLYGIATVLFLVFLYYVSREHSVSSEGSSRMPGPALTATELAC